MKVIHYSGAVRTPRTNILAGWVACCSGVKAKQIRANGNSTNDPTKVTCRACLRVMAKDKSIFAMKQEYEGPAVLRPDLIEKAQAERTKEIYDALKVAFLAIDALITDKPMLAAKMCGSTTLGNVRAEIRAVLYGR